MAGATFEFRLLGPFEVESDGRDLTPSRPKRRALLAALLLRANEVVSTDDLIEIVWADSPPPSSQVALQGHVSALRKALGADVIETRPPGYVLRADPAAIDARRFELLLEAARSERGPTRRAELLRGAQVLFRGEPLADFRYAPFAREEAARLEQLRLNALEERIEAELELGRHVQLIPELEQLVAENPFEERPRAALMLALYRSGRQAQALEVYAEGRRRLVDELGIDPGPALQQLERQILNQDEALDVPAPGALRPPTNLPVPATPLIGREAELDQIRLRLESTRLLTLTGTGGSGKTRLAIAAAAELGERFPGGAVFVELAALADAELVLPTITQTLGIRESGARTPVEALVDALADTAPLLVVLDNCEHVIGAAPVLSRVLAAAPSMTVLATSREPLHVAGERAYPVSPLRSDEAVTLFVERAQAARPDFELTETNEPSVVEICRRLDGLPLAIELAAARIVLFPPAALLARLDQRLALLTGAGRDRPERHQTLRAAIDWSHELLPESRRALFARLSVFAGGWTLEAAEAVCDGDLDVIDGLASLLDKGLVRYVGTDEEPRFAMLETIREYSLERLDERGDGPSTRRRHAESMLEFARTARGFARGPKEPQWLDRTQLELDNIRAALGWATEAGDGVLGLALAEALEPFWYRRTQLREGLRWLEPLLELAPDAPQALKAGALAVAGRLASELGRADLARPWYEESLPLARAAGDRSCEAWVLHGLGYVAQLEGDRTAARELLEQSHELFVELGEHAPAGGRLTYLAYLARLDGDFAAARSYSERAIDHYRKAGDAGGVAGSMMELGDLALDEGDWTDALHWYREALPNCTESRELMYLFAGLAAVAAVTGRAREGARLWGAAEQIESNLDQGIAEFQRARFKSLLGELDAEEVAAGRAASTDEALALAWEIARAPIPVPGARAD